MVFERSQNETAEVTEEDFFEETMQRNPERCTAASGAASLYDGHTVVGCPGTSSMTDFFIEAGRCFFNSAGVPVRGGNVP